MRDELDHVGMPVWAEDRDLALESSEPVRMGMASKINTPRENERGAGRVPAQLQRPPAVVLELREQGAGLTRIIVGEAARARAADIRGTSRQLGHVDLAAGAGRGADPEAL